MRSLPKFGKAKRILCFVLAFAMAFGTVAVTAVAAEGDPVPDADPNVHVLEASALAPFGQGEKADGDSETVADYFTILYSSKSKVDSSSKAWGDGYTSGQRINFGGKAATNKNSVMFKTSAPATVKIWWVKNNTDDRQMAILNSAGDTVAITEGTHEKDSPYIDTLTLAEAGTYYLGGSTNGNYIFKVEVTETPAAKEFTLEASSFDLVEGKTDTAEKAGTDGYFTINWGSKGKVMSKSVVFDDAYSTDRCISFDGASKADTNRYIQFTTSDKATVKVWWVPGGNGRNLALYDGSGADPVKTTDGDTKDTPLIATFELEAPGTYTLSAPDGTCYFAKVLVTEGAVEKAPPAAWETVPAPAITNVALKEGDPNTVEVTVSAVVGYDGADAVIVTMYDTDGWVLTTKSSLAEKDEHVLTFTPSNSGTYTFDVIATRGDEAVHAGAEKKIFEFSYPLTAPVLKYAANNGKGTVTVEWNPVKEATGYTVTLGDKTQTLQGLNTTRAVFEGLTAGEEVAVTVAALRGEETGPVSTETFTVSDEAEVAWIFSAFGQSTDTKNNGYEKLEDGSVHVYSLNGKGKVQPAAQDGLAFYYTTVNPSTTNFVLTATVVVNSWTYSNGQEGFGLLVMDQVGVHGTQDPVYCNSFMVAGSGLSGVGNNMRLGIGALARTGVTEYSSSAPATYKGTWLANMSGVGDDIRNLVGNCTNLDKVPGTTIEPALTSFQLKLEKNDEGYFVSYTDHNGEVHTVQYNDTLNNVDDYVYVGMFAARNMDVTFTNISFTTSAASGSAHQPGDGEEKTVAPGYSFADPDLSNTERYIFRFDSNADGTLIITNSDGAQVFKGIVKAGERLLAAVDLAKGDNKFKAVMTPNPDFVTADGAKLTSYEAVTIEKTVKYQVDSRSVIYVSPTGKDNAAGTKEDPTTLAAAVKCPAPGATIILLEGTYELTSGVTVNRGINGTAKSPISLIADPDAATRPVLDWGQKGNGLRLNADYWYLCGFDSTNSTAKGVHVGGSHNVVERVCTYRNMNTGFSISRINFGNSIIDWPSYNLVLNCSSWLNADSGYEDADGFEAKLTVGEGNVFDGCISAYNADDGWDLYARGAYIGAVTLQNCVAFKNGYDLDADGKEISAGNGNGFKLGGNNYDIDHRIINSVAFANKSNGITCNSNPNLKVENCTSFGNGSSNLSLYTTASDMNTAFEVKGFISYKGGSADSIKPQGTQDHSAYLGDNVYYDGHSSGDKVSDGWFTSLDVDAAIKALSRNENGRVDLHGFLQLTEQAPTDAGARLPVTAAVIPEATEPQPVEPQEVVKPDLTPTGDSSDLGLWIALMFFSAMGLAVVVKAQPILNRKK